MELLTLNDICKLLKITPQTGRNRLSQGLPMPPNFRVGRRRLFEESDLKNWLETYKVEVIATNSLPKVGRGRPRKTTVFLNKK